MSQVTFTGRLVQGDPHKPQPQQRDDRTGQLKVRKNGEPDCPFFVAIAIEKTPANRFLIEGLPTYENQKGVIDADARAAWPEFFGQRPAGLVFGEHLAPDCKNPKFSNKVIDGDGFDDKGRPFNRNEGWAGCWVIKFSTYFAKPVEEWRDDMVDGRGQVSKPDWYSCERTGRAIKLGDYVSITGTCESNKSSDSPGMYLNLEHVGFEKEGERITPTSGAAVSGSQVLGSRGAPSGAAGAGTSSSTAHGGQTSGTASGGEAYSGYRNAPTDDDDAPPPPADDTPPPPSGPVMAAKANGKSFQSFIDKGWTEAQLREHGYIAA